MTWGGAKVRRLRRAVLAAYPPVCHLCNQPIDMSLDHPHPMSMTVDHVVPQVRGGSDAIENLRPAHLTCNSSRQADPMSRRRIRVDERRFFE